jgi:membrane protein YdbS with pleckstrin-like domain
VKRALVDAELFAQVEQRLAQAGLRWIDNIYADHVSVALLPAAQAAVLGEHGLNASNSLELPRDAVALLVVVWALIVLPKRERQTSRSGAEDETRTTCSPAPDRCPADAT